MSRTPLSAFRLDAKIKTQLKKVAIDKKSTQTAIVREALNLYFKSQTEKFPEAA